MPKSKKIIMWCIWFFFMSILAVIMAYPLIFSVLGGFNQRTEFAEMGALFPVSKAPTFANFKFAFSNTAFKPLLNSIKRSAWYTIVVTTMAVLMGYVMTRYEFKGKNLLMGIIIVAQVIPSVLTLIPTFVMVSKIPLAGGNNIFGQGGHGLYNNSLILYLPLSWGYLMWVFLFMMSMRSMPIAFEEAAELDGCGFFGTLKNVILPMQKPIITVIIVNVALGTWNDWLTPFMYISSSEKATLVTYLATLTAALKQFGTKDYPKIFALAVVAILPPFMIFLFFQKYIVQGIASAGVKE